MINKAAVKISCATGDCAGAAGGADEEARTLYLHLGKVALYQMSYIRGLGVREQDTGFRT